MKKFVRRAVGVTIPVITILALAACGAEIPIDNVNGQGTCGGNAFTIATDQSSSGDNLTIDYTGPSTDSVGLFFAQGFYSDELIYGSNDFVLGDGSDSFAMKLDVTAPGWTTSGSGNSTTYSFSGSVLTLINGDATAIDVYGTSGMGDMLNPVFPAMIGVDCDSSHTTGFVTTSWAAAQPVFPNHMLINAMEIVSSEPITDGARVTFRYPDGALAEFGSFDPAPPSLFSLYSDDPTIPNDTISNMWAQGFNTSYSASSGSTTTNADGTFTVEFTGAGGSEPLPDGHYLLISIVTNQAQTEFKVVFTSMTYVASSGFSVEQLPFLPELPEATLPNTGGDTMSMTGMGIAGGFALVAGAVVLVAIRRRAIQK